MSNVAMIVKNAPDTEEFIRDIRNPFEKGSGKITARVLYIFEIDGTDYVRTKDFSTILGAVWCWGCPRTRAISIDFPRGIGANDSYLWPLDIALKARSIRIANPAIGAVKSVEMAVPMLRRMNRVLRDRCWKIEP